MDGMSPILHSLEVIENQISEKLTVDHIASSVHFSKVHYQRLFREMVGDSVMDYVTKRKLTLAGKELLETDTAIVDIAIKFGYDSREGFSRSFKAYMGVTPGKYRKYGLSSIAQKIVKERSKMTYSKTTNEIIRELNDFIVKAKETATLAREEKLPNYTAFWDTIADRTDSLANRVQAVIERITVIAERPDEITNRFAILTAITDTAFESNILAFNVGLMVSRSQPDHASMQNQMCKKYYELAGIAQMKSSKISIFFNELSELISKNIKESYTQKLKPVIQQAKDASDAIKGYENIKFEMTNFVKRLECIPFDEFTAPRLDDCLFSLNIILFASDMLVLRNPHDKAMFEGLTAFKDSLSDVIMFTETLPKIIAITTGYTPQKHMQDSAFQGNILLFYTRGEIETMNKANVLDDAKNVDMTAVCDKINTAIQLANSATDESLAKEVSQNYRVAAEDMNRIANGLGLHGNPLRFLATEIMSLADRTIKLEIA